MPPTRQRFSSQSVAPSPRPSTSTSTSSTFPDYQPLKKPLNPKAVQSLSLLLTKNRTLDTLKGHLAHSATLLTDCAGAVNDRNQETQNSVERRRVKGRELSEQDERVARKVDEQTKKCTSKLEEAMRGNVDGERRIGILEESVEDVSAETTAEGARIAAQSQSQSQRRRRQIVDDDGEEDEDEEMADADVVQQPPAEPTGILKRKLQEKRTAWERLPARERYATANNYSNFIRTVHDAAQPEENPPPLANASTWFDDNDVTTQPYYHRATASSSQSQQPEEDDDLVTTSVRISTRCPITTLPFKDPVTSKVCPHSFEKSAIEELIRQSRNTKVVDQATGKQERAVQCPECRALIGRTDLRDDPILLRKVKRILAEEHRQGEDEESADEASGSRQQSNQEGDSSIMESGVSATQNRRRIKDEAVRVKTRASNVGGGAAARQDTAEAVPDSQFPSATQQSVIVDLEDDDMEEEEEEEEEEGESEDSVSEGNGMRQMANEGEDESEESE